MTYARVFKSGDRQAIRLPKGFRIEAKELEVFRRGDEIVLRERRCDGSAVFDLLVQFPDDFMADEFKTK